MTTLEVHFNYGKCETVDDVTTFWQSENNLHIRTSFDGFNVEHTFSRKVINAVFEVINDERRRII